MKLYHLVIHMFYRKDIFIFKWQQLQWNEICCPIPLFYISWNVSVTFSINYTKRCTLPVIDRCISLLNLISNFKRKMLLAVFLRLRGEKKWQKMKGNPIHLGSRWTSEIKIGPLRCKCWNNILRVGSTLLMYIVYKPGVSLSRVATPVKWSWWRCCWSKGPAMSWLFRDRRVVGTHQNSTLFGNHATFAENSERKTEGRFDKVNNRLNKMEK